MINNLQLRQSPIPRRTKRQARGEKRFSREPVVSGFVPKQFKHPLKYLLSEQDSSVPGGYYIVKAHVNTVTKMDALSNKRDEVNILTTGDKTGGPKLPRQVLISLF